MPLRIALVVATTLGVLTPALNAGAETRIFIVENQRDDYGVDQCLASGANCGRPVASAYCQSRQFAAAVSFRKVDREEITGGSVAATCQGAGCTDYVAIECLR
jgi:hypothetical protein